ncbi:hypothetical protein GUITHDRAFT_142331 [Guillardia theta CCMP2712]|uniref:Uncharacterized protein n=1 Tax=Guillardia theta (strain CCMP2712) TaxID=905079 RepID=L1IXW2_GUITC|nr:hypothetical protein GUITHDRAFT_142331 [Guillardia theta CCMP2712]EKX40932.1 hypothetical protein GUITHDRAFT_142331 [Guillardia theta CCMP2712]|eukprot:XP_005827912.1 hypothetical protein GUITHDRAFT_142331 [Guillardia theta CCMP2712]
MPLQDDIARGGADEAMYRPSKDEPDIGELGIHLYDSEEESVDSDLTSASQKVVAPTSGRIHSSFTSMYLRRNGNDEILQRAKAALALQRIARQEELRKRMQTVERSRDHVTKWLNENYIVTYTHMKGLSDGVSIFEQASSKGQAQVQELDVELQSMDGEASLDPDPSSELDVEGEAEDFDSDSISFIEGLQADDKEFEATAVPEFRKPMPEASADFIPLSCNQIFSCSNSVPPLFPLQEGKSCDEAFDSDDDDLTSSFLASPQVPGTDGFFSAGAEKAGCCLFRNPIKMHQSNKSPRISSSMLEKLSTHAISEESALSVADTPSGKDFQGRDSPYSERSTEEGKGSSMSEGAASNERILQEEHEDGSDHDNNLRSESWISRDSQQKEYALQVEQLTQYSSGSSFDAKARLGRVPRALSRGSAPPVLTADMVAHSGGGGQGAAVSATKMHPAKSIGWAFI